ncbi:hypothetical protein FGO68_gene16068 [Halteria grandinella]|uniref:Uncharacterized protein n=1 Tax=Halteria grandinella TaxID=5974 RepID=A0A8J8NVD6_HALGN|nr:hypothetical protein FGO68_gene16068 [Halteria grandinella]
MRNQTDFFGLENANGSLQLVHLKAISGEPRSIVMQHNRIIVNTDVYIIQPEISQMTLIDTIQSDPIAGAVAFNDIIITANCSLSPKEVGFSFHRYFPLKAVLSHLKQVQNPEFPVQDTSKLTEWKYITEGFHLFFKGDEYDDLLDCGEFKEGISLLTKDAHANLATPNVYSFFCTLNQTYLYLIHALAVSPGIFSLRKLKLTPKNSIKQPIISFRQIDSLHVLIFTSESLTIINTPTLAEVKKIPFKSSLPQTCLMVPIKINSSTKIIIQQQSGLSARDMQEVQQSSSSVILLRKTEDIRAIGQLLINTHEENSVYVLGTNVCKNQQLTLLKIHL